MTVKVDELLVCVCQYCVLIYPLAAIIFLSHHPVSCPCSGTLTKVLPSFLLPWDSLTQILGSSPGSGLRATVQICVPVAILATFCMNSSA